MSIIMQITSFKCNSEPIVSSCRHKHTSTYYILHDVSCLWWIITLIKNIDTWEVGGFFLSCDNVFYVLTVHSLHNSRYINESWHINHLARDSAVKGKTAYITQTWFPSSEDCGVCEGYVCTGFLCRHAVLGYAWRFYRDCSSSMNHYTCIVLT